MSRSSRDMHDSEGFFIWRQNDSEPDEERERVTCVVHAYTVVVYSMSVTGHVYRTRTHDCEYGFLFHDRYIFGSLPDLSLIHI